MNAPSLPAGLEHVIVPRTRDLGGGFEVRRALPSAERRMVGPFIFFDQMGPTVFTEGQGLDVRPHPHIGLATVTYLFRGEVLHRDSLGTVQRIRPGEVNWMIAGRGIAHSERSPEEARREGASLFGIQTWIALPRQHEETAPGFTHFGAEALPAFTERGVQVRLIAGSLGGLRSPVPAFSEMFYADAELDGGARLTLAPEHEERAVYVAQGSLEVEGGVFQAGTLLVVRPGAELLVQAPGAARLLLLGGAPMDGERHIFWNFVSSSRERIEQAKDDWRNGRFASVPDETEFIPLPEAEPPPVHYP